MCGVSCGGSFPPRVAGQTAFVRPRVCLGVMEFSVCNALIVRPRTTAADHGLLLLANPDWRARRWLGNHVRHIHRERGIESSVHTRIDLTFFSSRLAPPAVSVAELNHHHTLRRHLPSSGGREGSQTPAGGRMPSSLHSWDLIVGGWLVEVDDEDTIGQRGVPSKKKLNLYEQSNNEYRRGEGRASWRW